MEVPVPRLRGWRHRFLSPPGLSSHCSACFPGILPGGGCAGGREGGGRGAWAALCWQALPLRLQLPGCTARPASLHSLNVGTKFVSRK